MRIGTNLVNKCFPCKCYEPMIGIIDQEVVMPTNQSLIEMYNQLVFGQATNLSLVQPISHLVVLLAKTGNHYQSKPSKNLHKTCFATN